MKERIRKLPLFVRIVLFIVSNVLIFLLLDQMVFFENDPQNAYGDYWIWILMVIAIAILYSLYFGKSEHNSEELEE